MYKQRKFIFIAAVAGLIAMFLPWVTVSAGGIFEGSGEGSMSENGMHGAGIGVFLSFLCAIALSLLGEQTKALEKTNWLVALAAGAGALLFAAILLLNMPKNGPMEFVKSSVGYGAWMALAAAVVVLVSAWMFKNPEDTLKGNFDKLKSDFSKATLNGTGSPSDSLKAVSETPAAPANAEPVVRNKPDNNAAANSDKMDQVLKLIELKSQGKITEEEYQQLKSKLL